MKSLFQRMASVLYLLTLEDYSIAVGLTTATVTQAHATGSARNVLTQV
jgi:hypothetical protein